MTIGHVITSRTIGERLIRMAYQSIQSALFIIYSLFSFEFLIGQLSCAALKYPRATHSGPDPLLAQFVCRVAPTGNDKRLFYALLYNMMFFPMVACSAPRLKVRRVLCQWNSLADPTVEQ